MEIIREVFLEKVNTEWGFIRRERTSNQKMRVRVVEVRGTYRQERSLRRVISWDKLGP